MPDYIITLTDSPAPADIEVVKQGLDAYDAFQGAVVDWVPLALFAREAAPTGAISTLGGRGPISAYARLDWAANFSKGLNKKPGDAVAIPLT